ncbi:hypothetical protein BU15DRAFT_61693 [Melanogaster broomeanus]|nr:hypothetical protein BU15DRAFT_61693 [Melanogaster broomeanus]
MSATSDMRWFWTSSRVNFYLRTASVNDLTRHRSWPTKEVWFSGVRSDVCDAERWWYGKGRLLWQQDSDFGATTFPQTFDDPRTIFRCAQSTFQRPSEMTTSRHPIVRDFSEAGRSWVLERSKQSYAAPGTFRLAGNFDRFTQTLVARATLGTEANQIWMPWIASMSCLTSVNGRDWPAVMNRMSVTILHAMMLVKTAAPTCLFLCCARKSVPGRTCSLAGLKNVMGPCDREIRGVIPSMQEGECCHIPVVFRASSVWNCGLVGVYIGDEDYRSQRWSLFRSLNPICCGFHVYLRASCRQTGSLACLFAGLCIRVIAAWMERRSPGVAKCRKAPRLAGRFGGMNIVHGYIIAISTWRRRPPPTTIPSPNCEPTVDGVSPSIREVSESHSLSSQRLVGSHPKQPWMGGGRGSGSPLTRAFAGSKPPLPPRPLLYLWPEISWSLSAETDDR